MLPGQQGNELMRQVMTRLRTDPPRSLGGMAVVRVDDSGAHQTRILTGEPPVQPVPEPSGELIIFHLAGPGNRIAARPSGTEPKIKFYRFGHSPVAGPANLPAARDRVTRHLGRLAEDIRSLVWSVVDMNRGSVETRGRVYEFQLVRFDLG